MTEPTSRTSDRRDRRGGFTLLELALALAILSLLAALALPRVYPGGGATTGRATAYAMASVLREDRNAALASGGATTTRVDTNARTVASGSGGGSVVAPADLEMTAPDVVGGAIVFLPDGRSSGGSIVLKRGEAAYSIRVDPVTGGVQIATGSS